MPYVICGRCQLRTYSAALWAATDVCPRCDSELPRPHGTVIARLDAPLRVTDAPALGAHGEGRHPEACDE
ncbi:MAG TPA: hypothetical protein VFR97_10565 [Capillimicrobium sp.]|nr:hypothetical protein [Capillimicrobium sp.]